MLLPIISDPDTALETLLPPGLVNNDGGAVRKIQTAASGLHRQAEPLRCRQALEDRRRQATRFRSEKKRIAWPELLIGIASPVARAEREYAGLLQFFEAGIEIVVYNHIRELPVIESRTFQARFVELESEWLDKMQLRSGIGA